MLVNNLIKSKVTKEDNNVNVLVSQYNLKFIFAVGTRKERIGENM